MTDSPVAGAAPRRKRATKTAAQEPASKPARKPRPSVAKPASRVEAAGAATAPPKPPPQPAAEASASAAMSLDMLSADQREGLEKLSLNLARAAMTAQGAIAEAALRAGRPAGGADGRSVPRRPGVRRGDGAAGRPARPADARAGRPLQPLHGPLEGRRRARARRAGDRGGAARPRRQALRRSRLDPEPGVRRDQAVLPDHLRLAERAGGRRRGRRAADQAAGRVLHEDAHRRDLALELPALQPRGAARGDADARREPRQGHGELRRRPAARRRPAVDQPDRLHPVQGRRERRHRAGQGGVPERADPAAAVRRRPRRVSARSRC